MRVSAVIGAAALAAAATMWIAGAMSCGDSWIEDEPPYPIMRRVNVTALAALADGFLRTDAAAAAAATLDVHVRLRMNRHGGAVSARLNKACGYEMRANGTAAAATVSRSAYLPAYERAVCRDGHVYRAQFVRPGGTHLQTVRLPGAAVAVSVELRANGRNYLTIGDACVMLRGGQGGGVGGGGGDARAFCVDLELLKSCWCLQAGGGSRRSDYYLGFDGVSLAMSKWNVREVVFRDVAALADGFRALARDADDADAQRAVCGRVELVPGELDAELDSCPVEKRYATTTNAAAVADVGGGGGGGGGAPFEFRPERMNINRLLYGCAPRSDDTAAATGRSGKIADAVDRPQKSGARPCAVPRARSITFFFWFVASSLCIVTV